MSLETVFTRDDISIHFLGNEALLFDSRQQKMAAVNESAATILEWLVEGKPERDIVQGLVERFGLPASTAEEYLLDAVEQWRRDDSPAGNDVPSIRGPAEIAAIAGCLRRRPAQPAAIGVYRLLDTAITVRYATESLYRACRPPLQSFAVVEAAKNGTVFDLFPVGRRFVVVEGDRPLHHCRAKDQVVPMIKACFIERALEDCMDFCAVHAGAVGRGEHGILLPGGSGAGKSVLVAALLAKGFDFLSDDTVVLTRPALAVRPVPFGICIKEDAWNLVAGHFPELMETPVHDRPDGKRVRYLTVRDKTMAPASPPVPVSAIVFPRYDPDAATALAPLDKNEALRRLMSGFQPVGDGLSATDVDQWVHWIENRSCYALTVSSLNEAAALMDRAFP